MSYWSSKNLISQMIHLTRILTACFTFRQTKSDTVAATSVWQSPRASNAWSWRSVRRQRPDRGGRSKIMTLRSCDIAPFHVANREISAERSNVTVHGYLFNVILSLKLVSVDRRRGFGAEERLETLLQHPIRGSRSICWTGGTRTICWRTIRDASAKKRLSDSRLSPVISNCKMDEVQ